MPFDHLQGKRSGRPRGSKSSSPVKRDLAWASRNLGKDDVVPPTPGALFWLNLARHDPARFVDAVVAMDAATKRSGEQNRRSEPQPSNPVARAGQRRKTIFLTEKEVCAAFNTFSGTKLPAGARLVGCEMVEGGFNFTVFSKTFERLAEGQPFPELRPKFAKLT